MAGCRYWAEFLYWGAFPCLDVFPYWDVSWGGKYWDEALVVRLGGSLTDCD